MSSPAPDKLDKLNAGLGGSVARYLQVIDPPCSGGEAALVGCLVTVSCAIARA